MCLRNVLVLLIGFGDRWVCVCVCGVEGAGGAGVCGRGGVGLMEH